MTYNSSSVLPGFFAALPRALVGAPAPHVIVVDNNSSDGSLDLAQRLWPESELVQLGGNRGYAAGINAGIRRARTEAFLVLNPDIRLGPKSVAKLRAQLRKPIGITVPRLIDGEDRLVRSLRREPSVLRAWGEGILGGARAGSFSALGEVVQDPEVYEQPCLVDWASGAVMMISRSCWEAVGGWDESFFLYAEEADFALRARDAGYRLRYVPEAWGVHEGGRLHLSGDLWALNALNRVRLYRRRHGVFRTSAFWAGLVAGEALRALFRGGVHGTAVRTLVGLRAPFGREG